MARDSVGRTFLVATVLCIVCSVLVSAAAVALRPRQAAMKALDKKKNILAAASLYDAKNPPELSLDAIFEKSVERVLINLKTGEQVGEGEIDLESYDQRDAARNPELSEPVEPPGALASITRREKYAFVYRVNDENGQLSQVVLPIYGKGLWSTLYGFIAIRADASTINGITFYEHKETPGLGGEVDNPKWKALWVDKQAFVDGKVEIEVLKGKVNTEGEGAVHQVDGISGATITTRGVSTLVRYWLGENGFGPYLEKLRNASG